MRRVLAVDDDPSILGVVKDILLTSGYTITTVSSGTAALERIELDSFDLVITDLRMPGMSGSELIGRLRQHPTYRKVPILVLATGAEEAELGALKVDMRVGKPFAPRTLLTAVTALIG
jgi:CheY-like chemotaxis protein